MPTQDVVLGLYYLTRERVNAKGEGKIFAECTRSASFYEAGFVDIHAKIKSYECQHDEMTKAMNLVETTVGRAILSEILPKGMPFSNINQAL